MVWFPNKRDNNDGWRFDIVSLVAVIGEYTSERHVPLITTSPLSYLPRLFPAPQVLLKTERPLRLPAVQGIDVIGVYSGTYLRELNFFADFIHHTGGLDVQRLEPYEYRVYKITMDNDTVQRPNGQTVPDVESQQQRHTETIEEKDIKYEDVHINSPFCWISSLTIVTLVSVFMLIGLFIWATCIHDGVAMIALVTMSLSASIACWANRWHPVLSTRRRSSVQEVPPGNVILRTRNGSFILIKCEEDVTRQLYTCIDKCEYAFDGDDLRWRLATSTVLLMASIIFFSNCSWTMQTAIGVAYIILNMLYWIIPSAIKDEKTWDLKQGYHIERVDDRDPETHEYTQALWYAIRETRCIDWVKNRTIAPPTRWWDKWLDKAWERAMANDWNWNADEYLRELMKEAKGEAEFLEKGTDITAYAV